MFFRSVSVPVADAHNLEHYIFIPPDGGYGWVIVTVAFVANFLIDGVTYTFGIFLSELSAEFKVHPTQVALITSYMGGFYYLTGIYDVYNIFFNTKPEQQTQTGIY